MHIIIKQKCKGLLLNNCFNNEIVHDDFNQIINYIKYGIVYHYTYHL